MDAVGNAGGDSVDHCLIDWADEWYTDPVGLIGTQGAKCFSRWEICHEPDVVSCNGQQDLIFHVDHAAFAVSNSKTNVGNATCQEKVP